MNERNKDRQKKKKNKKKKTQTNKETQAQEQTKNKKKMMMTTSKKEKKEGREIGDTVSPAPFTPREGKGRPCLWEVDETTMAVYSWRKRRRRLS